MVSFVSNNLMPITLAALFALLVASLFFQRPEDRKHTYRALVGWAIWSSPLFDRTPG
jgi:hypothetical protein